MKKLLFVLVILLCQSAIAQKRISEKELEQLNKSVKEENLLPEDEDFAAAADNTKWSGESAVILCQKTQFNFDKKGVSAGKRIGRNIWGAIFALPTLGASVYLANMNNETKILVEERERRKIMLRDKYALEQYSILYFRFNSENDAFAARVIKKDGSIQAVDLSESVKVEDVKAIPGVFRSYTEERVSSYYRPNFYKIAVPDLEEGDVLEYAFKIYNTQKYSSNINYKEFEPVYYICNREMPVARQVIEVVTEDDKYYIGYKSLKGAPDFTQTSKSGKKIYRWVDNNRDKLTDTRYVNEFIEQPSVKFQIIYARSNSKGFVWFKNEEEMKKDISPAELSAKVKTFWFNSAKLQSTGDYTEGLRTSIDNTVSALYKTLKKRGITESPENDFVVKTYYTLRSNTMYSNWSDFAFAKVFSGLLEKQKIPHEVIVSTSNEKTQLSKVAFTQEISWLIKYKGKYYSNPNDHQNPEEIPAHLNGNACVRFNYNDEKSAVSDVIPVSDTSTNAIAMQLNTSLSADQVNLNVAKTVEAKGLMKDDIIDDILSFTPYMESDYRNYDGEGMWEKLSEKDQMKATEEFSKEKKEWKEEKPKMMQEMAQNEYGVKVEKYGSFRLVTDGRAHKKRILKFSEDFILTEVTAVAGSDIIVALPSLLGQQTKINSEERTRSLPIDLRYPRTLLWKITMTVPDGYSVKGLESLNNKVDNTCGSFISAATVEGNKIILDVKKIYKKVHFEATQWNEMLAVLDAAYNYSQSKIILKKN
jgi:hypothetical protein